MFRSIYFRLGLVFIIALLAILIALPRIPIKIQNGYLNIDSFVGGYAVNLFNGSFVKDLRDFRKGLDIQGGIRIVLQADMSKIPDADKKNALQSATEVISRRVNLLGVSEPYITNSTTNGNYRIIVEIPGISDVKAAVDLIGQTAQLVFKELAPGKEWTPDKFVEYFQDKKAWVDTNVTGADLKGAEVVFAQNDPQNAGRPQIQLKFSDEGRKKFSELAKKNVNKPIALYLDTEDFPLSMPTVSADLINGLTGDPVINGSFDVKTANGLSVQIRAGALPVPVQVLEQKTIGATLGTESVNKSFVAGALGLLLVLAFMIVMYGSLGVLSGIALIIYAFLVLAIFKFIPVVLTLPGIAGFILSVGMATDANILIFERVKEEIRWGKPRNLAMKLGFDRAWNSIKDSNVSSLITCAILFYLGTGPVRGFALTLAIGIFISLFSSIFVVRTLIQAFNFDMEGGVMGRLAADNLERRNRKPRKWFFSKWIKNANH